MDTNGNKPKKLESIEGLMFRLKLINFVIKFVRKEGDPHGVIDQYIDQAKQVNAMIREYNQKHRKEEKPDTIVINLKTADMTVEGQKGGS